MYAIIVVTREETGLYVADDESLTSDVAQAAKYESVGDAQQECDFITAHWDHQGPLTILKL